ncbi:MAG: AAA family ATPase [Bacteriovoracia bacterium]
MVLRSIGFIGVLFFVFSVFVFDEAIAGKGRNARHRRAQQRAEAQGLSLPNDLANPTTDPSCSELAHEYENAFFKIATKALMDHLASKTSSLDQLLSSRKVEVLKQVKGLSIVRVGESLKAIVEGEAGKTSSEYLQGEEVVDAKKVEDFYFVRVRQGLKGLQLPDLGAEEMENFKKVTKGWTSIDTIYIFSGDFSFYDSISVSPSSKVEPIPIPGLTMILVADTMWFISKKKPNLSLSLVSGVHTYKNSALQKMVFDGHVVGLDVYPDPNIPVLLVTYQKDDGTRGVARIITDLSSEIEPANGIFESAGFSAKNGDLNHFIFTTSDPVGNGYVNHILYTFFLRRRHSGSISRQRGLHFLNTEQYIGEDALDLVELSYGGPITAIGVFGASELKGIPEHERISDELSAKRRVIIVHRRNERLDGEIFLSGDGKEMASPLAFNNATFGVIQDSHENDYFVFEDDPGRNLEKKETPNQTGGIEYLVLKDEGTSANTSTALGFSSNVRITDFTFTHPAFSGVERKKGQAFDIGLIFAKVTLPEFQTKFDLIFDPKNKESLLIPGLTEFKTVQVGNKQLVVLYGEWTELQPKERYLAIYDVEQGEFLKGFGKSLDENNRASTVHIETTINTLVDSRDLKKISKSKKMSLPLLCPFDGNLSSLEISYDEKGGALWIKGPSSSGEKIRQVIRVAVDRVNQKYLRVLPMTDPQRVEVEIRSTEGMPSRFLEEVSSMEVYKEKDVRSVGGRQEEVTKLTAIFPSGRTNIIEVSGKVTSLKAEVSDAKWSLEGTAEIGLVTESIGTSFSWGLSDPIKPILREHKNISRKPIYEDENISMYSSDAFLNERPRLYYKTKRDEELKEIELLFDVGSKREDDDQSLLNSFIAAMFGLEVEESKTPYNESNIVKVEREGDLFFIHTKPNQKGASRVYVWSIKKMQLLFAITNMAKFVDVGELRFYVGQATAFNDTAIAVFDKKSHQFIRYFDFKKLLLDTEAEDFVRAVPEKKQIEFKTQGGLTRVFDETTNTFVGLLPQKVEKALSAVSDKIGTILNTNVFMNATEPLYGRDDVLESMAGLLMPGNAQLSTINNVMMVAPPGAGMSHILEQFMSRWISGGFSQSTQNQLVFFRIDPNLVSSNTMYRGQFASKFSELRKACKRVQDLGYRVVIVWENAHLTDLTPHNFGEGDIFENHNGLVRDGFASTLATSTPAGLEFLSRRQPAFVGLYKQVYRVSPMNHSETVESVESCLAGRGRCEALHRGQIQTLVSQAVRLNSNRALPGTVFDVVKMLLAENPTGKLTNAQVQAILAKKTGIPRVLLDSEHFAENKAKMKRALNRRVVGHEPLVEQIVDALFSFAEGISRSDWPIFRALLAGMTGTGKTEMARAIVGYLFDGDEGPLLKINGADYGQNQDPLGLSRLISSHIRKYPFNVILPDEFERMAPAARDIILTLGDGSVSDEQGGVIPATLSIILATSNAGEEEVKHIAREQGLSLDESNFPKIIETFDIAIHRRFSAPVLNRFDTVYIFTPLRQSVVSKISADYLAAEETLATQSVAKRFAQKGIDLEFDESVVKYISQNFVDLQFGARRLTIRIEQHLVNKVLAAGITSGKLVPGGKYIVKAVAGEFVIEER